MTITFRDADQGGNRKKCTQGLLREKVDDSGKKETKEKKGHNR